jgi:hypothetical protein
MPEVRLSNFTPSYENPVFILGVPPCLKIYLVSREGVDPSLMQFIRHAFKEAHNFLCKLIVFFLRII